MKVEVEVGFEINLDLVWLIIIRSILIVIYKLKFCQKVYISQKQINGHFKRDFQLHITSYKLKGFNFFFAKTKGTGMYFLRVYQVL